MKTMIYGMFVSLHCEHCGKEVPLESPFPSAMKRMIAGLKGSIGDTYLDNIRKAACEHKKEECFEKRRLRA